MQICDRCKGPARDPMVVCLDEPVEVMFVCRPCVVDLDMYCALHDMVKITFVRSGEKAICPRCVNAEILSTEWLALEYYDIIVESVSERQFDLLAERLWAVANNLSLSFQVALYRSVIIKAMRMDYPSDMVRDLVSVTQDVSWLLD